MHQMLIVFPLGLLAAVVIFDLIYLLGGRATMGIVSYWMIAAGIVSYLTEKFVQQGHEVTFGNPNS